MQTLTEFADTILTALDKLADTSGITRVMLLSEIYKMVAALKEGIQKDQTGAEKVKKFLEEQLRDAHRQLAGEEPLQSVYHLNFNEEQLNKEENQNGSEQTPS